MNLNTENIIKLISKNQSSTNALLEKYISLNENDKFRTASKIWDIFDLYYEGRLQVSVQKALNEVAANKKELSPDFYKQVKEQTDKEIEAEFYSDTQSADLVGVRDKISKIISN